MAIWASRLSVQNTKPNLVRDPFTIAFHFLLLLLLLSVRRSTTTFWTVWVCSVRRSRPRSMHSATANVPWRRKKVRWAFGERTISLWDDPAKSVTTPSSLLSHALIILVFHWRNSIGIPTSSAKRFVPLYQSKAAKRSRYVMLPAKYSPSLKPSDRNAFWNITGSNVHVQIVNYKVCRRFNNHRPSIGCKDYLE